MYLFDQVGKAIEAAFVMLFDVCSSTPQAHTLYIVGRPTLWSPARVGAMCALQNDEALTQPAPRIAAAF